MLVSRDFEGLAKATNSIIVSVHKLGIVDPNVTLVSEPWSVILLMPDCFAKVFYRINTLFIN